MMGDSARADVTIAGRGFQVATSPDAPQWAHRTIPLLRRQFDVSAEAGESSLNPEGPWRRTIKTWFRGAGQVDQDGVDANVGQFFDSRRADVWEKGQVSALSGVTATAERAFAMTTAPYGLYSLDDVARVITRRSSGAVTSVTMSPTDGVALDITTDGDSVWVVIFGGTNPGLYRYNSDLTGEAHCLSSIANLSGCEWTGDRLMVWTTGDMYDMSTISYAATPQAAPAVLLSLNLPNLGWRTATWGQGFIYMGTTGGDIYRTAVKPDGTSLDTPVIAASLPSGEWVKALYGYLGFVVIASTRGFRLSRADAEGNLTVGQTVEIGGGISDAGQMIGRGRFIYFGVAGLLPDGGGVYRMDLSILNDSQPAYAADIWAGIDDTMYSIGFDGDDLLFGTLNNVYEPSGVNVADGWVETGIIDFGIPNRKVAKGINADVESGTVAFEIVDDGGTTYVIGSATPEVDGLTIPSDLTSRSFKVKATLSADAVLRSFTLLAYPTGVHTDEFQVSVVLAERQHLRAGDMNGAVLPLQASTTRLSDGLSDDLSFLRGLRDAGGFINYLEGETEYTVQVDGVGFIPYELSKDRRAPEGVAVVTMKSAGQLGTSVDPVAPNQVTGVSLAPGDTQILVTWDTPYNGGSVILDYDVRYSDDAGASWTEALGGLDLSYLLSSLTNGTEYLVGVRATNEIGDGPWSASASETPAALPDAPTGLAVTG